MVRGEEEEDPSEREREKEKDLLLLEDVDDDLLKEDLLLLRLSLHESFQRVPIMMCRRRHNRKNERKKERTTRVCVSTVFNLGFTRPRLFRVSEAVLSFLFSKSSVFSRSQE